MTALAGPSRIRAHGVGMRAALVFVLLFTSLAPALAQPSDASQTEEARALFEAGRVAYDAGRYAEASDYFERSYALTGAAAILYNSARAAEQANLTARAVSLFERFLTTNPSAQDRTETEIRLRDLRVRLAAEEASRPPPEPAPTSEPAQREVQVVRIAGESALDDTAPPRGGIETEAWFWILIGVLGAGAIAGGIAAIAIASTPPPPLLMGDNGITYTLVELP